MRAAIRWISFVLVVVGSAAGVSGFFSSKLVVCTLDDTRSCPADLEPLIQKLSNRSLFLTDFQAEARALTQTTVYSFVELEKRLPNQLHLTLSQATPEYRMRYLDQELLLSATGAVFNPEIAVAGDDLVVITVLDESPLTEDGSLKAEYHESLSDIVTQLRASEIYPSEIIWVSPQEIRVVMSDQTVALFDQTAIKEAVQKLHAILTSEEFQTMLKQSEADLETPSPPAIELDLRMKLPVLRTSQ